MKKQFVRGTTPDPLEYFWANVKKDEVSGCWNWIGNMFNSGYGQFKNSLVNKTSIPASRAAWFLLKDKNLDRTDFVCHKCDNRRCCNPDHLFIGKSSDNMKDASEKRRINHGEDRPQSKLTEEIVREARKLRQQGMGWLKLAARYDVAQNCIRSAVMGETWSHVDEPVPTYIGKPGNPRK